MFKKKKKEKVQELFITEGLINALVRAPGNVSVTFCVLNGRFTCLFYRGAADPEVVHRADALAKLFNPEKEEKS